MPFSFLFHSNLWHIWIKKSPNLGHIGNPLFLSLFSPNFGLECPLPFLEHVCSWKIRWSNRSFRGKFAWCIRPLQLPSPKASRCRRRSRGENIQPNMVKTRDFRSWYIWNVCISNDLVHGCKWYWMVDVNWCNDIDAPWIWILKCHMNLDFNLRGLWSTYLSVYHGIILSWWKPSVSGESAHHSPWLLGRLERQGPTTTDRSRNMVAFKTLYQGCIFCDSKPSLEPFNTYCMFGQNVLEFFLWLQTESLEMSSVFNQQVYDLSEFMDRHPGGPTTILAPRWRANDVAPPWLTPVV